MKKKRRLTDAEKLDAEFMLNVQKKSFGQIARYFRVNKPSIKKSLGLW